MEFQLGFASLCALALLAIQFISHLHALNDEGIALNSFKAFIKQDPDNTLANWNSSSVDPCSWNGIICQDGKVTVVSLPKKRLFGTLSPALGFLPSLRHINLRGNRLQGQFPVGILNAKGLQSLVLSGNSISGPLPPEIGGLSYLQSLDLSDNSLAGEFPTSLLQCTRLKLIDLSYNNLTGPLPDDSWSNLSSLEKLSLSYNSLNGSIPSSIGNLSSLNEPVDLSHNLFSGEIPASLGNLPEKVYIDLGFNNLTGPIPQNGALLNRGPTAFIGNPGLCGPPLKNPCSPSDYAGAEAPLPILPTDRPPLVSDVDVSKNSSSHRGLRKTAVAAIVVSDVVAIGVMAIVFYYCYHKAISRKDKGDKDSNNEAKDGKNCCICFGKDTTENPSENPEHLDLIPLDKQVKFDLDELLKATAFVLGKSNIGMVYKVVLEGGLTLAVRRLGEAGTQRFKEFQTEVEAIGKVRHPNIVCLRAYYWSIDEKLLIYDYIPNGNLSSAIHGNAGSNSFSPLPWDPRLRIMKGIAKGLAFLHEFSPKKYVHGDLKPNNILLGVDMEPYISDFGLGHLANIATPMMLAKGRLSERMQSPFSEGAFSPIPTRTFCYQAPEALNSPKPSQKWDVYSYGVILLEMISGRSAVMLMDVTDMDIVHWVQLAITENKPLFDILDPCLAQEPEKQDEYVAVLKIALACVQENQERRPSMKNVADSLEKLC